MILPLWYAILFGVVIIGFSIVIIICTRLYPNYSMLTRTISGLGNPKYKSHKLFNPAMMILGLATLPLPYYVYISLPPTPLTTIGCIFFICNPIGIFLVGVFNEEKNTGHIIGAVLGMGFLLFATMLLIYPLTQSDIFHPFIVAIAAIAIINCVPLAYSAYKSARDYVGDVKIDRLLENINFFEWMEFLILQMLIISMYLNLVFTSATL
jgi:hypothetical membrane protein